MKRKLWNTYITFTLMISICIILNCTIAQAAIKKPGKTGIEKAVSTESGKLKVIWKKTPRAEKYQVQAALNKKFTNGQKTKTISAKKQKYIFTKLQAGKKYYVRVRAYRIVSGKKYYGTWSVIQSVRIKGNYTSDPNTNIQPDEDFDSDTDIQPDEDSDSNTDIQPDEDSDSDTNTEKKIYLLSAGYTVQIDEESAYVYTGEEFRPKVTVSGEGLKPLTEGNDYAVSYQDNINVGTASIIVTGKGKYEGELSTTFKITYAEQDLHVKLSSNTVYVGETAKLEYTGNSGNVELSCISRTIAKIDADGTITGLKPGFTYINVYSKGDKNHKGYTETVGPILVGKKEPNKCEFYTGSKDVRTEDGGSTFVRYLKCDAAAAWLDDVEYEVTDVTPPAWAKAYADLGVPYTAPTLTASDDRDLEKKWVGEQTLTIHAGPGIRVVYLVAKKNGTVLDSVYLKVNCKKSALSDRYDFSEWDIEMYRKVRQKIEEKIWTEDMTTHQKLKAVADYLNSVMHYPDTATVSKEYNPTYWKKWEIAGNESLYKGSGPDGLMMCYLGGMGDCWTGVTLLDRVAMDDLGLSPLYDSETDSLKDGEGFWIVQGAESSAPNNPYHRTFRYRDSKGQEHSYDVQGMGSYTKADDPMVSCENHDCSSKIISLKD